MDRHSPHTCTDRARPRVLSSSLMQSRATSARKTRGGFASMVGTGMLASLLSLLALPRAAAHCPLCTLGAAAAAGGAVALGVHPAVIGIFIGAFAASMGYWIGRRVRRFMRWQVPVFVVLSWLTTVLPLRMVLFVNVPLGVFWFGDYGTLFMRTYVIDLYLVTAAVGAAIVVFAPSLSAWVSAKRGRQMPYQGMLLTFGLLLIAAVMTQVIL